MTLPNLLSFIPVENKIRRHNNSGAVSPVSSRVPFRQHTELLHPQGGAEAL